MPAQLAIATVQCTKNCELPRLGSSQFLPMPSIKIQKYNTASLRQYCIFAKAKAKASSAGYCQQSWLWLWLLPTLAGHQIGQILGHLGPADAKSSRHVPIGRYRLSQDRRAERQVQQGVLHVGDPVAVQGI